MNNDFTSGLANFMLDRNECLSSCLRKQEELLEQLDCTNSEIGNWIKDFEKPILLEILNAPDSYFFIRFPELSSFGYAERQKLAEEIEYHIDHCDYCKLKVQFDSEWENNVEASLSEYRTSLNNNTDMQQDSSVPAS